MFKDKQFFKKHFIVKWLKYFLFTLLVENAIAVFFMTLEVLKEVFQGELHVAFNDTPA